MMYTIKEAAEKLGMSVSWIDKMCRAGSIKFIRMGGVRRITEDEIARILLDGVGTKTLTLEVCHEENA